MNSNDVAVYRYHHRSIAAPARSLWVCSYSTIGWACRKGGSHARRSSRRNKPFALGAVARLGVELTYTETHPGTA